MFKYFSLQNVSISSFFRYINIAFVALLAFLIVINVLMDANREQYTNAYTQYQHNLTLSRELRQTSDDLHRMALISTLNSDPTLKDYYWEIAGILYGENMRPLDYYEVYWDYLLANGIRPRQNSGQAMPFPAMLHNTELNQAEINLLLTAYENIQNQINIEIQAVQYSLDKSPKQIVIQFPELNTPDSVVLNYKNDSVNITQHKALVDSLINLANNNYNKANLLNQNAGNNAQLIASKDYFATKLKVTELLNQYDNLIKRNFNEKIDSLLRTEDILRAIFLIFVVSSIIISFVALLLIGRVLSAPLNTLQRNLLLLSNGELPDKNIQISGQNELARISQYYNKFINHLQEVVDFANQVGKGNYESKFKPLGTNDALGGALINMRDSLQKAAIEEAERKELDLTRNWSTAGLAYFGDILREQYKNEEDHYFRIVSELVRYTSSVLGGLFLLGNTNEESSYVELVASYAYNTRRFRKKKIKKGDGIIGTSMLEQEVVHLNNVPPEYSEISSGLGQTPPKSILIVPIRNEKMFVGVIELGAFEPFPPHVIEFVKHLSDDLASTFATIRANKQTQLLLQQSRVQSDELASQEEEMRQNLEELQATQEEMARREAENNRYLTAIDQAIIKAECDKDGRIIDANQRFVQTMGYSILEIDGKPIRNLIHRVDSDNFDTRWAEMTSQNLMFEISSTFKTSTDWLWLKAKFIPVIDETGRIEKVLFVAMDFDSMFSEKIGSNKRAVSK